MAWAGATHLKLNPISLRLFQNGSEWDPVILPVFKTGARHLRGVEGVFDSHTLPPNAAHRAESVVGLSGSVLLRGTASETPRHWPPNKPLERRLEIVQLSEVAYPIM